MKKLKWLMPTLGIASIAASIPCVATSCSSMKYEKFSYKFDSTNKAKDFLPKDSIGQVELEAYQVTHTFIDKMNENKQILADTIAYGIINDFFYWYSEEGADEFTKADGTIDISIGNLDPESSRCTLKYSFNLNIEDQNYVASVDMYNIPFCVYRWTNEAGDESWWCFAPVYTALARPYYPSTPQRRSVVNSYAQYVDDWKITINMSGNMVLEEYKDNVKIRCAAQNIQDLNYFIYNTDYCLVGQSFNKIPYLKDMSIKE